ncbi:hypothetical protein DLAC_06657 [Tieghemostelium lacteum]|uniref:THO complex subunit 7 n=1 Tax=Tieghemostelium lacteum TaxID=361077 RepID=A0A151ZFB9_TIELA|nr:hypothetical protein DLAC_06657 [Tieghemostelium lacteum]|eukprot:KYQ92663.1 hypothetical protein DLAC_06657 [Tieghemostelium lacteum]
MEIDEEEKIIKNRLIYKDAIIKRAFKKYLQFIATLNEPSTGEQTAQEQYDKCVNAYLQLSRELSSFELVIQKAQTISDIGNEELQYYDQLYQQRTMEIENEKKEIAQLKEQLSYEKIQRQYKEQYLSLYKLINEKPSIEQSESEILQAQKELDEITDQMTKTNNKLELRSKQFQLLLHTLNELDMNLDNGQVVTTTTTTQEQPIQIDQQPPQQQDVIDADKMET